MPNVNSPQRHLFLDVGVPTETLHILVGHERLWAQGMLTQHHYLHSVPSAKSYYMRYGDALLVYAIPANPQIARFILGEDGHVWELSRLWAPDGHRRNLLTQAIAASARMLRHCEPALDFLLAYADPSAGHTGHIYRAASWTYTGQSDETRAYHGANGQVVARRAFHGGNQSLTKAEIVAMGFTETQKPGKYRYIRPMSRRARRACAKHQKVWKALN